MGLEKGLEGTMAPMRRNHRGTARWGGAIAVAVCALAMGPGARGDDDAPDPAPPAAAPVAAAIGRDAPGLAFDAAGRLYVADERKDRVTILGFGGEPLGEIGAGALDRPTGVAIGPGGVVLVSDAAGVHRFGPDGAPAGTFAADDAAAVAAAPDGTVYVSEPERVARFAPDGTLLGAFAAADPRGIAVAVDGTLWVSVDDGVAHATAAGAPIATAPAQRPEGVAAAPDGTVLVAERKAGRVVRLAADGSRVGTIEDGLKKPRGVAVDCRGNVAISDHHDPAIHRVGLSPPALPPCAIPRVPAAPEPVRPVARRLSVVPAPASALAPVLGRSAMAAPLGGTVGVRRPGARAMAPLGAAGLVPMGTRIDTREGRVRLTFATRTEHFDTLGTTQSGEADSGLFAIAQPRGRSLVELRLAGPAPVCALSGSARPVGARHLWVSAQGSFRTRGRFATATARNARWLTEDRCDGTLVRVTRGSVLVRDRALRRALRVPAGGRYLAQPRTAGR
jgi:hypothetical protein